jgi:hypothetical protein
MTASAGSPTVSMRGCAMMQLPIVRSFVHGMVTNVARTFSMQRRLKGVNTVHRSMLLQSSDCFPSEALIKTVSCGMLCWLCPFRSEL